ncbi:MAG: S24 family peptidase [Nostoc sp. DedSLP03]|uniref:LexA family protein n=1 Tax=Nostoc sp. DedSLP03 TaxID=3075400 RepID=UPI002AD514D8|nr:S24 family peptidase [Nostoc sp. DedSLP03]MDZ7964955.1 S24 family peptidase [Nostoc sp. DedSLP03]
MPRGGSRKGSGRKYKFGEPLTDIGVPSSISNDLIVAIENLWEKGIKGEELIDILHSAKFRKVRKYDYPVSAGIHSTSSVGGDSMNIDYEEIDLCEELINESNKTIILPVMGDSMIDIGIYPGDWLIVELIDPLYQKPKEEEIVIVSVDYETLVKRYRREKGEVVLVSENKNHEPIRRSEGSIYISGIVKSAICRNLSKRLPNG